MAPERGISTALDLIDGAALQFTESGLHFGHGTDNARDEAAFLVLHALDLPVDSPPAALDQPLTAQQVERARALIRARIERRVPAAYLTGRMWFAGREFHVDERVLVPRSPLAELVGDGFQPWLGQHPVERILDIGTGSGCIAISAALAFPHAEVDATDVSSAALAVAARNRERYGLEHRLTLYQADLFPPDAAPYDIIVSNPPYVPAATFDALPAEYRHEPRLALAAGDDGLACVARIVADAGRHLRDGGLLVVEVGELEDVVEHRYGGLGLTWIDLAHGGEGVFVIGKEQLPGGG